MCLRLMLVLIKDSTGKSNLLVAYFAFYFLKVFNCVSMLDFKMTRFAMILPLLLLLGGCHEPTEAVTPLPEHTEPPEFIERMVIGHHSTAKYRFFNNHQIFSENWDTLGPARFWQEVFSLSHDSMIINVASLRKPLYKIPASEWHCQTESEKSLYKENLCIAHNLETSTGNK